MRRFRIRTSRILVALIGLALVSSACSLLGLGGSSGTPTISSVSPSSGPVTGGTVVTINGSNLTGASAVNFGTAQGTNINVTSDTSLTVTAPPEPAIMNGLGGKVQVTVTTAGGTSSTCFTTLLFCSQTFTYVAQQAPQGCHVWSPGEMTFNNLSLSHTFSGSNDLGATVGLNAPSVTLAPSANVCLSLSGFSVSQFQVGGSLGEQAQFNVSVSGPVTFSKTFPLLSQPLGTITVMAGPIPVVIVPALQVYATISGAAGAGATISGANGQPFNEGATMSFEAGLVNGQWSSTGSVKCTESGTACISAGGVSVQAQAGAEVQANLWAQVAFLAYDLAGPDVQAGPMAQAAGIALTTSGSPWWAVCGGVQGGFGLAGNARLFGGTQWIGKTYNLWGPQILTSSSGAPTDPSAACDPNV